MSKLYSFEKKICKLHILILNSCDSLNMAMELDIAPLDRSIIGKCIIIIPSQSTSFFISRQVSQNPSLTKSKTAIFPINHLEQKSL